MYGKHINYKTLIESLTLQTQLEIWSWVLGKYVSLNQFITNPLRIDSNPNCKLREYNSVVLLTDYAWPEFNKYTCIHAIGHVLSNIYHRTFSLNESAEFIAVHLHYGTNPILTSTQVVTGRTLKGRPGKSDIHFIPYTNKEGNACFIERDKEYWSKRFITSSQLEGRVYSAKVFYINNRRFIPKSNCYVYLMPSGKIKVYQPFESKENKWFSVMSKNDYWLTERSSDKLLISKCNKDHLVEENIFLDWDIYSGMNESVFPSNFGDIVSRYKEVWSILDNDNVGIKSSQYLREAYNIKTKIINPNTNHKDLDEWVITQDILPKLEDIPLIDLI